MTFGISREVEERLARLEIPFNRDGIDPYGVDRRDLGRFYTFLGWFYRHYFTAECHGIAHVPKSGRVMLVGNHAGGVALDAGMVVAATFFEMEPPRLAHGMADKFLSKIPFTSFFTARSGQLVGLPEHARRLLVDDRMLLVFPEGHRGTAKLFRERYSLVRFGTGFVRLALETGTPIVPFAFIGGGEAIPTIANLYKLGRIVGVPYVPVTPYGLALPLPVQVAVHFGAAMRFDGDGSEDDAVIEGWVAQVKDRIATLIEDGRRARGDRDLDEGTHHGSSSQ